jgi:prepilin-type N-terminal cleavage/methylation domain-containing protein
VVVQSGRRVERDRRDRGFTLVETMAAMGVLAVIATAAAAMLIHALGVTTSDRQRVRAASAAAQEVERIRGLMQSNPSAIVNDAARTVATVSPTQFTVTSDPMVSGTSYHLVDTGEWSSADSYKSLKLTVTATWTNMGAVQPVVNSSILTINGTGGNGSGGSSAGGVTVTPVTPDPVVTLAPTCSLNRGTALVGVNSTVNVPAGLKSVPWSSTFAGTVVASPMAGNPCTTTIPLTNNNGVFSYSLPYGGWNLTATLPDGAIGTSSVTVAAATATATPSTILVSDNCGGTKSVQFTVQTQNSLLSWLLQTVLGATITGTRATNATCSTPVDTTTFSTDLVSGLLNGTIAYGPWTFTAPTSSGTAGAVQTVSGSTNAITLTANYSSCPTGPVKVTLNTLTTLGNSLNGYTGTVTATPGTSNCSTAPVSISLSNGSATKTLSYGDWTFAAGTSSKVATVNSSTQQTVAMNNIVDNCGGTATVTVSLTDPSNPLIQSYNVRATRAADSCGGATVQDFGFAKVLGIPLGAISNNLAPGVWTFSLTAPSGKTLKSPQPLTISTVTSVPVSLVMN